MIRVEAKIHHDNPSEQSERISPRKVDHRRLLLAIREGEFSSQASDDKGDESSCELPDCGVWRAISSDVLFVECAVFERPVIKVLHLWGSFYVSYRCHIIKRRNGEWSGWEMM